jgi:uncharacterized protein YidB (DUF937 family)
MTSAISPTAGGLFSASASTSSSTNWLADTLTSIQSQQNQGGLLGMLANAGNGSSLSGFLSNSSSTANAFATISENNVTSAGSLFAQIAATNQQKASAQKLQDSLNALSAQQSEVQPKSTLAPVIYLSDGSTIDTINNIMTMSDGTQYDTTTGAKYVDPASIQQLGGGAYLNTKTNIMTLADGTQIDTVTGLTVTPTT